MTNSTAVAIERCRAAYREAMANFIRNNGGPQKASEFYTRRKGNEAFRDALPQLSSRQNILDFIACVVDGVLIEAILETTSSKLVYAAQIALNAFPRESRPKRSTPKSRKE
jgi:hypothetical protein